MPEPRRVWQEGVRDSADCMRQACYVEQTTLKGFITEVAKGVRSGREEKTK